MILLNHKGKALAISLTVLFLYSCASYNEQAAGFYSSLSQGNYEKASRELDHNRLLHKNRNRLLYLLEKGKVEHLLHHYEKSNEYLNEADLLMESSRTSAKDIAAGTLLNPMMQTYQGEDFEKYMVHYYKALNYLQLHQTEDALVEARRISLRTYAQQDVTKGNRYAEDAFSLTLQGMIYEKAGDLNNAFISYRNAANVYLENDGSYYGTQMPEQLKKDVLRLAWQNGFLDELERYESIFEMRFDPDVLTNDGELILFWENGLAPVKHQQTLFFTLLGEKGGDVYFTESRGSYKIPFDRSVSYTEEQLSLAKTHTFKIAIPVYQPQPPAYHQASLEIDGNKLILEPAQNINELALATLQERRLKDLSFALTRLALKKVMEEAAKPKDDEKDKKKKNKQEALSLSLKLFGLASEKADTRNWQSLPHSIYYVRIPLKPGHNKLSLTLGTGGGQSQTKEINIENKGGLQFFNLTTL